MPMESKNTKRKITEMVEYILTWLCYGDAQAASRVAYTADVQALDSHDVMIVPNNHLGNSIIMPDFSPVKTEHPSEGKTIIRTDIVYNTFFFISRAEETFNMERDEHNRFAARFSVLGNNHRLLTPMLDEHAHLLMEALGIPLPTPGFQHIFLTHDIDFIARYRYLRGILGGLIHGKWQQMKASWKDIQKDPFYTFPWMTEQDTLVPDAQVIYFVKQTRGKGYDYPQYNLSGKDFGQLKKRLLDSGAQLGVHSSYYGDLPKNPLSTLHRTHYLCGSVRQWQKLSKADYTDDFTMGFADAAGFRLQTTRAVRWINPFTMRLTRLTMHPLIIMDTTLSNEKYMNLSEDEAFDVCQRLINSVRKYRGDLCLLWHNSSFTPDTYHKTLYGKIIQLLNGK